MMNFLRNIQAFCGNVQALNFVEAKSKAVFLSTWIIRNGDAHNLH